MLIFHAALVSTDKTNHPPKNPDIGVFWGVVSLLQIKSY